MLTVALLSSLTGAVLGLRFRVYALVPAFALACVVIGVTALVEGDGSAAVWRAGAALLMLQVGYVLGIATRFTMAGARSTSRLSASHAPSRQWPVRQDLQKAVSRD